MTPSNKKTIFLVHGLRGSHHGFNLLVSHLAEHYNIINLDLPGTGTTPELTPHNLDSYIEYLHDTITKINTSLIENKPIIIAHSMGTIIASHYAEKYPDDTAQKLILISPIFRSHPQKYLSKGLYYTLRLGLSPFPKSTKKKILASKPVSYAISHFLTIDKSQQKHIDEAHFKYSGRFSSARSILSDIKLSSTSTAILPSKKNTLIIMGKKDRLVSTKITRTAAKEHSATYREVAGTGHLINYERPTEAAVLISEFLGA